MCVADKSDDKLLEKIKAKYHVTLTEYPMVRVANADKTEHLEGRGETVIQGQQIGIYWIIPTIILIISTILFIQIILMLIMGI